MPLSTMTQQQKPVLKQSTCPYCGVGCGVDVLCDPTQPASKQLSDLQGTSEHPANFGRLCVKGSHLLETNGESQRLHSPLINGRVVTWDAATQHVADKLSAAIAEHGPDAVAFYVSGQLLTEDYYVANKLMKGYIGSANIDTNSRLCMSSAVAAYKRAFGADAVPCSYEDLEQCDLLIITGSNAAWTHPVLFQRMERAKRRNPNMKVVVVDPRETATCSLADLHLPLKPGTDAAVFNGLLQYLADNQALDKDFIQASTQGFDAALAQAESWTLAKTAAYCELDPEDLADFYRAFAQQQKAITFFSMGINQSTTGVDKGNAIINCHLATGKIGKPGAGPFSITGQPNAMGGREVGGLANMLAAHMDIDNPDHREQLQGFWQSPTMATKGGLKAVDLFKRMAAGEIKFVWIMATNPVVSMPNRVEVEAALKQCETVVVSDIVSSNDTLNFATVALPATGWSEKDGMVTNSERRISRQRGLIPPYGEAKHDWQIMCDVAKRMGFDHGFDFASSYEVFREHAKLSGVNNNGTRAFDISGLADITEAEYDGFIPMQWPINGQAKEGTKRLFTDGNFYTPTKKANFIPITPVAAEQTTSADYPFILNTGRMRDQWHTMTRTGKATQLLQHTGTAELAMNPTDAEELGVEAGQLMALNSAESGERPVILPLTITPKQKPGSVFAPIHWSETWGSHCAIGKLFSGANDAISGQPELKHGAVSLSPVEYAYAGQLVVVEQHLLSLLSHWFEYWVKVPAEHCFSVNFATDLTVSELLAKVYALWGDSATVTTIQGEQGASILVVREDKLVAACFVGQQLTHLPLDWLEQIFTADSLTSEHRAALLRQTPDDAYLQGKLICSCFGMREKPIEQAILDGATSVDALGETLKCGTNCGSCRSELATMVERVTSEANIPITLISDNGETVCQ